MFLAFYYYLKAKGLEVSLQEYFTLLEGLDKGLADNTLYGFYTLCRCVLLKSEYAYDLFDEAFLEFFAECESLEIQLSDALKKWLDKKYDDSPERGKSYSESDWLSQEEIRTMLEERLKEQKEEHNGGSYWVGTRGQSAFGHSGFSNKSVRVGGESHNRTAFDVIGERRFRDFRKDKVLDRRQFQVSLRTLRQLSSKNDEAKTELDIDDTIRKTGDNAGHLVLEFQRPRKNTVKLLLLMDSGGSMERYSTICSELFQAARAVNCFKDIQYFYFHNCIKSVLYTTPEILKENSVSTQWVMNQYGKDYKVIVVGDALMDLQELTDAYRFKGQHFPSGLDWLRRLKKYYPYLVWLNPEVFSSWMGYWGESYRIIEDEVDMYPLTPEGLESAMHKLMKSR